MIRALAQYFSNVPPVFTDGAIYAAIAFFSAWGAAFATDEAEKWIAPHTLFWLKASCTAIGGTFLAVKMFRSTAFATHQQEKKAKGDTAPPFKV